MLPTYLVHILAGGVGLVAGFVALYSVKGAGLHRRSGRVFVYAMLTMACLGMLIAAVRGIAPSINIPAGLLTSYLVITALVTVRPALRSRRLDLAALLVALGVGLTMLTLGVRAVANGAGMRTFPFFMFAAVGFLGFGGDVRVMRSGALQGARRLARHLWRMCFALFIAALSFSVQLLKIVPKPMRIPGLLLIPMLVVLGTMGYWLWRVRARRTLRGRVIVTAPETV